MPSLPSLPSSLIGFALLACLSSPGAALSAQEAAPSEQAKAEDTSQRPGRVASSIPQVEQTGAYEGVELYNTEEVVGFYQSINGRAIWFGRRGLTKEAKRFIEGLKSFEREGLSGERYHRENLEAALRRRPRGQAVARFDILLTDTFLSLARDMSQGRVDPASIGHFSGIKPETIDTVALLMKFVEDGQEPLELIAAQRPTHPQYSALVEARLRLHALTDLPWIPIALGPEVSLGERDRRIPQVASRLAHLGEFYNPDPETQCDVSSFPEFDWELYSSPSETNTNLDQALATAILRFQGHRGLKTTGSLNDETITALNRPPAELLLDIDANLERWRWLPESLGDRYVWINIPTFDLVFHEEGSEDLTMAVVVGRTDRQTPELVSSLTSVQLNPTWTVTPNIASRDILPRVKRDPGYLAKKKMILYDGWTAEANVVDPYSLDWSTISYSDIRRYRIVQQPGPSNALGTLKLRFANDYSVYMHDTDHRNLFSRDTRTFSSGCVRLDQPVELTSRILDDNGYTRDEIDALLRRNDPINISLKYDPAVYITYFTAIVDEDGGLSLLPDYYGRDDGLINELEASTFVGDGDVAP